MHNVSAPSSQSPANISTATGTFDAVPAELALEPKVGCIAAAMDIIGSKWTALILRDLAGGPRRFGALEKSVGSINPRTLSQRLDDLEAQGIVTKQACSDSPTRPEYKLTQKGLDLVPVLIQMAAWGTKYYPAA